MAKQLMDGIKKFLNFLQHDLWRIDLVHNTKLEAIGIETLRVIHLVLKGVKEDNCKLHASALTYATLMAMVPFMVIVFSIGKAIGFDKAEDSLLTFAAEMPEGVQEFIHRILEIVQGINPAALGAVGGIIFLYIIFKLLSGIEESFNQIWGVQASRGVGDKLRNYLSVLVIAPALMLIANAGSVAIQTFAGNTSWLGPIITVFIQLAPILILSLAFVSVFMFLPNTRVSFKPAAVGGLTSAALVIIVQFIILKFSASLFQKYAIYGSFASIPIFLFWLHLNWVILLFGAELAFAIQNRDTYAEEQASVRASVISKLWVAFSIMQEAVRIFQSSEASVDAVAYARKNNIPVRLMNEVIEILARAQLLGTVVSEGQDRFALLQAPEQVTAKKIYDLLITDGSSPADLGLIEDLITDELLTAVDINLDGTLDPVSLRKFMDEDL